MDSIHLQMTSIQVANALDCPITSTGHTWYQLLSSVQMSSDGQPASTTARRATLLLRLKLIIHWQNNLDIQK